MENLDKIGEGNKPYNIPPMEEGLINKKLPPELLETVFSYLEDTNAEQANLVNHHWSKTAIDTAKKEEFLMIKGFTNLLGAKLQETHPDVGAALLVVGDERIVLNALNLKEIKSSMRTQRENILNILKGITDEDLNKLEESLKGDPKPGFFENVFGMAKLYKQIDKANEMPNGIGKVNALKEISKALLEMGNIDKAFDVADAMMNIDQYNEELESTAFELARIGLIKKSVVLHMVLFNNGGGYRSITKHYLDHGNIEKAEEFVRKMPYEHMKICMKDLSGALVKSGQFEKAIELRNMLDEEDRDAFLGGVSLDLIRQGNTIEAREVVNMISDEFIKELIIDELEG